MLLGSLSWVVLAPDASACPYRSTVARTRFAVGDGALVVKVKATGGGLEVDVEAEGLDAPLGGDYRIRLTDGTLVREVFRFEPDGQGDGSWESFQEGDWRDFVFDSTGYLLFDGEELLAEKAPRTTARVQGVGRLRNEEDTRYRALIRAEKKSESSFRAVFRVRVQDGIPNGQITFRFRGGAEGPFDIPVELDEDGRVDERLVIRDDLLALARSVTEVAVIQGETELEVFPLVCR